MRPRRTSCLLWSLIVLIPGTAVTRGAEPLAAEANRVVEVSFTSAKDRDDPFNAVELDVVFTAPDSKSVRVPAFWAGGKVWRVRYASPVVGVHSYATECNDTDDKGLHGAKGTVEVRPYQGDNPFYRHGPIKVASDRRHFAHEDGTPFFWLGDTWWMGLTERLVWPGEFKALTSDRKAKGFDVIQIVAGLYPDMPAFDERGRNEAGFPWDKDYHRIRPEYFDRADERLTYLADQGLAPCIVMAWGYHLPWLGVPKMKQHVRYVIARYGALPVVWCMAGEVNLPYYLEKGFPFGGTPQAREWAKVIAYARSINGLGRLVTVHPTGIEPLSGRLLYPDRDFLDFDMLQTGHGLREVLPPTIRALRASYNAKPTMPVLNSEVCYEALLGKIPAEIPRLMFWTNMLEGAAGHTYGANGIWQLNRRDRPYGKSPHGGNYGTIPWDESMNLPGSRQLGLAKGLFEQYPWPRFEPHPEWASWANPIRQGAGWGDWIWSPGGEPAKNAPEGIRYFRKTFDLPEGRTIEQARLRLTADDSFTVFLNGRELGSHGGWNSAKEYHDIAGDLRTGKNVLAVRAENAKGPKDQNPAGLIVVLDIQLDDHTVTSIVSDKTWRTSPDSPEGWQGPAFDDKVWPLAIVAAKFGEGPWGRNIGGGDDYLVPYAGGIAGDVRILYIPSPRPITVHALEAGTRYVASYFDPVSGRRTEIGAVKPDPTGDWTVKPPGHGATDWVLVLSAEKGRTP